MAIIIFTIIIRLIMSPLMLKAQRAQKELSKLQPEIKKTQEQFKNDREAQGRATMALYTKHKVNPFSGCLMMLLQFPLLIALFSVFQQSFKPENMSYLYSFVTNPGVLNPISFGILDLSQGNIYLGVLAAVTQYIQSKLTMVSPVISPASGNFAKTLRWQALYFFPVLILVWSFKLPSALMLYWTVLNFLGMVQEIIVKKMSADAVDLKT